MTSRKWPKAKTIPAVYDNHPMKERYLAIKEKLSYSKIAVNGYGNPENRLWSIQKELEHITKANNFDIFYMGGMLVEAKNLLPHGKFGAWIEKNVPFSPRTANSYMNVYRVCLGMPELLFSLKRSVLEEVCSNSYPPELHEKIGSLLRESSSFSKKDFEKLKKEYIEGNVDIDSDQWQLFIMERQQSNYEEINIRIISKLEVLLNNELLKLEQAIAPPTDVNRLLNHQQREYDLIPALKKALRDFLLILRVLKEDYMLSLSVERNEFFAQDIKKLQNNRRLQIAGKSVQCECLMGGDIDDGTLAERYDEMMVGELSPEDIISSGDIDDGTLAERYDEMILGELSPEDIISSGDIDDGTLAERYDEMILGELSPEDVISSGDIDDGTLAERYDEMILGELSPEDIISSGDIDDGTLAGRFYI